MEEQLRDSLVDRARWEPLLSGADRDAAMRAARSLLDRVVASEGTSVGGGLLEGGSGMALALTYGVLSGVDSAQAYAGATRGLLGGSLAWAASATEAASLFTGLSGVAWVVEHVSRASAGASAGDALEGVDRALARFVHRERQLLEFDLLYGLVGIGVYALQRMPRPIARACLERVVDLLDACAVWRDEGAAWLTRPEAMPAAERQMAPRGYLSTGVAHGSAGVVWLLAQACRLGVRVQVARQLAEAGVAWVLARQDRSAAGGFPVSVSPAPGPAPRARASWCHGNPGIAVSLVSAADALGRDDWREAALEMGRSAVVASRGDSQVSDAGLCHGTTGLAHLFGRLYAASGEGLFADAARYWISRSVELAPALGTPGFLSGQAGAALALLAAAGNVEPGWDRVLLLS